MSAASWKIARMTGPLFAEPKAIQYLPSFAHCHPGRSRAGLAPDAFGGRPHLGWHRCLRGYSAGRYVSFVGVEHGFQLGWHRQGELIGRVLGRLVVRAIHHSLMFGS